MSRALGLSAETGKPAEVVVAKLLSTLHAREMWAHLDVRRSTDAEAVFVYGANVPTPTRRRAGKGEA